MDEDLGVSGLGLDVDMSVSVFLGLILIEGVDIRVGIGVDIFAGDVVCVSIRIGVRCLVLIRSGLRRKV